MNSWDKLPKLKIDKEEVMRLAEGIKGMYTYPSDIRGTGFITDNCRIVVVTTRKGYLVIDEEDVHTFMDELSYIVEENERRRRD